MVGYIRIYRSIIEHWIWQDATKLKWWLDILIMANYKSGKMLQGNKLVEIKRGTFHTSEVKLSERWGVTRRTVNTFLNLLEEDGMIATKRTKNGTTIEVLNYNEYQELSGAKCTTYDATNDTADDTDSSTVDDTQSNKVNKDKKVKNKESSRFTPPTLDEVSSYCKERNNNIDAEGFIDFYEANGWMVGKNKMKDWKATIRNWERRSKSQSTSRSNLVDEAL